MRIVHLISGAGPMYCGSCLHGNTLAAALRALGQDVLLAPLYTPLRTDEENVSIGRLAMGGINVYLQEQSAVFRHTPWFVDMLLDSPGLVRWAAQRGASVRPERLGAMAVSVLRGEKGRQRKEIMKLIGWLQDEVRPEVVHLSNVLLAGLARPLREHLGVPVVSSLAGEDLFLDKLPAPYSAEAWTVLRDQAGQLAALTAMNRYYADLMAERLAVPRERIEVIPAGLNLAGHKKPGQDDSARPSGRSMSEAAEKSADWSGSEPFSIGYLARICPEKGLHQLAQALKILAGRPGLPPVRVRAAGYLDRAERPYLDEIQQWLGDNGLTDHFEYQGEPDLPGKIRFLQSLDVLCVPTVYRESRGLFVLEAWANGVPVVLPAHGAFPEMVEDTGGGLLFEPGDPAALADALAQMALDREEAAECGRRAQGAVHQRYTAEGMARKTMELYARVVE
jgi:glycosyltransferase involved in cell wall biosynthesis